MTDDKEIFSSGFSRRGFFGTAAVAGVTAAWASAAPASADDRAKLPSSAGDPLTTPVVNGLHLQFGADASSEVVVSWHTLQPVKNARAMLGETDGSYGRTEEAVETSYVDAKSGQKVYAYHAKLTGLAPSHDYVYAAIHEGAQAEFGSFKTGPRGRGKITFTSFGDQGTPTLGKKATIANGGQQWVNDNLGSPAAGDMPAGVERVQPLFHLFNGDLCYANLSENRVRTWTDFWDNNSRSARHRPWMPAAGNHENELGNGPIGYAAYQTYFSVPPQPGQTDATRGLWYSFTAGSVRIISLANDDVCYQDGGNSYVRGYSQGAQKAWLEKELSAARSDKSIDWVVICMHQVVISTAGSFNGADLGIRQEWVPLFDKYGVDLVVCGHEHHYERSHPIRGQQKNATLTPIPADTRKDVIDTTKGTVHMVLGGGGTSVTSNQLFTNPPVCRVITAVGEPDPTTHKRPPVYVQEDAPWSAQRDAANSYGFASFSVDPGTEPGGTTKIEVTYYNVTGPQGQLASFETFTLQRSRTDSPQEAGAEDKNKSRS
ncbi:purple acid phosphatase family protein [Pseudarthrobacter phenanthrenivorans]|uniref:purple acid phosphatase family protein n=1 Tax=Pseudarthrobacter phenanthrenivorans TaxID=361575 RepID=UPI002F35E22E